MTEEYNDTAQNDEASHLLDDGAVEEHREAALDDIVSDLLQFDTPDEPDSHEDEHVVSEEHTNSDDLAVEEEIEPEDDVEDEEELDAPVEDDTDDLFEHVDYAELKDKKLPVKVNGEIQYLTMDQINSEVGRSRAGDNKVEDVNRRQEELDLREKQLANVQDRMQTSNALQAEMSKHSQIERAVNAYGQQLEQVANVLNRTQDPNERARANNDYVRISASRDAANRALSELATTINNKSQEYRSNNEVAQMELLNERGYGHLMTDPTQGKALQAFIYSEISQPTQVLMDGNAEFLMLAADAHKWRTSQSKKPKLKGNGTKTLKSGNGKVAATKNSKKQAANRRLSNGTASENEIETARFNLAQSLLG